MLSELNPGGITSEAFRIRNSTRSGIFLPPSRGFEDCTENRRMRWSDSLPIPGLHSRLPLNFRPSGGNQVRVRWCHRGDLDSATPLFTGVHVSEKDTSPTSDNEVVIRHRQTISPYHGLVSGQYAIIRVDDNDQETCSSASVVQKLRIVDRNSGWLLSVY